MSYLWHQATAASDAPALRVLLARAASSDAPPANIRNAEAKLAEIEAEIEASAGAQRPPPDAPAPAPPAPPPGVAPLRITPRAPSSDHFPYDPSTLSSTDPRLTERTAEMVSLPAGAWEAVPESAIAIPCVPFSERVGKLKAGQWPRDGRLMA